MTNAKAAAGPCLLQYRPTQHRPIHPRAIACEDLQARRRRRTGHHFSVCRTWPTAQSQAGRARPDRPVSFCLPDALRQEPRRAVRLHDRPGAQGRHRSLASSWCWSSCPTTRASTAKPASSCSTCSATPPTSGPSAASPFRCFYSFAVPAWRATPTHGNAGTKAPRRPTSQHPRACRRPASPSFGMNMPLMSSAFDTAMWMNAA